ncbi:MAG: sugar phosphate isomerase/epimerase [Oscillospiraceae bacterium]|nr:sugar phosphate isomerase/epimerase [Oscillospiraceae bacterium]
MNSILCSTGALITRRNGRDHKLLSGLAERLKFDGFELMLYQSWYENLETISEDIARMGVNIPAVHCEKEIGELISAGDMEAYARFEANCRAAERVGAKLLVLHLWNGLVSDSNFSENLKAYERFAETAEKHKLLLTVENVVCNVSAPMERRTELKEKYPEISFTFDTKMAAFHGELEKAYDENLWQKHIRHLHINDFGGKVMDWSALQTLHIGKGNVNFEQFFGFARKMNYKGDLTVEATSVLPDGSVDIDKLNEDFLKIKGYIA